MRCDGDIERAGNLRAPFQHGPELRTKPSSLALILCWCPYSATSTPSVLLLHAQTCPGHRRWRRRRRRNRGPAGTGGNGGNAGTAGAGGNGGNGTDGSTSSNGGANGVSTAGTPGVSGTAGSAGSAPTGPAGGGGGTGGNAGTAARAHPAKHRGGNTTEGPAFSGPLPLFKQLVNEGFSRDPPRIPLGRPVV